MRVVWHWRKEEEEAEDEWKLTAIVIWQNRQSASE